MTIHIFFYFEQRTNQCTINGQIIIPLLQVSALLCHLQGACSQYLAKLFKYCISWPTRHTVNFSLEILEKNNDECILILVIYWKKTGLLYTKISNHNIIYSS